MSSATESHGRRRTPSASEILIAAALAIVQVVATLILSAIVGLQSFTVDACGPAHPCDFQLTTASLFVTPAAGICALVLTVVTAIVLGRRERRIWLAPIFGTALVIVAFVAASVMSAVSTR